MNDAVRGSIIVIIGFIVAIVLAFVKDGKDGKVRNTRSSILFVLWMVLCATYIVYHFLKM